MNFAQVEQKVAKLRQDLSAGRLTEEECKAQMRELMVEDEQDNWWMVGYETGEWYRHDGTDWARADPPGRVAPGPSPPQIVVLLSGLALTVAVGWAVRSEMCMYASIDDYEANATAIVVWLTGFILTLIVTRKVWRGK